MNKITLAVYTIIITVLGIILDQASKIFVLNYFEYMQPPYMLDLLPILKIVLVWNDGISFSLFSDFNYLYLSVFIAIILTGMLIYLSIWAFKQNHILHYTVLALIASGGLGNLIDRFRYGAVIDFIYFHWEKYYFPAFNFADMYVTLAVFLFAITCFLNERKS